MDSAADGILRQDGFMDPDRVLRQRLATQRLSSAPMSRATQAVRLLTCVQSQERDHAFYSLAMRSKKATYAAVQRELDRGGFVRTHILRPTWHFVLPEDLRWILALTSPRVEGSMAARHRQLGLDDAKVMGAGLDLLADLLRGRTFLTRHEIGEAFVRAGSPITPGEQLGHLLLVAELRGLICSGPMKGVHHSYALIDEVIPPARERSREEALLELACRFFAGHGPAGIKDFTRWSSLTVADAKTALAEAGDTLERVEVGGQELWFDPTAVPRRSPAAPTAYLFPTYDEAILTYPTLNFPSAKAHPYDDRPDPFWAWVVADGVNVGLWKRTVRNGMVEVETRLAPGLKPDTREAVREAAGRLARFLERDLTYIEGEGKPNLWGGDAGHPATRRRAPR
jgi:hypothetical protein